MAAIGQTEKGVFVGTKKEVEDKSSWEESRRKGEQRQCEYYP